MFARLRIAAFDALPTMREAVAGSLAWAAAMTVAAWIGLIFGGWEFQQRIALIAGFFAVGGLLAFVPAIWLGRLLGRKRPSAVFAATFLALAFGTITVTAFLFAMQYRLYFAMWHEHPFSVTWIFQFVFTTLSAIYQFLVLGVRLYLPFGVVALATASWWNAQRLR